MREHDVPDGENIGLIAHTVRYCAGIGSNVIVEGILVARHYRDMLREVLTDHHGQTHVFYLDGPLEETLRRHATRPLGAEVSADKLREWYVQSDTSAFLVKSCSTAPRTWGSRSKSSCTGSEMPRPSETKTLAGTSEVTPD